MISLPSRLSVPAILLAALLLLPADLPALKDIATGETPPSFTLPDPSGAEMSLDHFSGGPGVIIFWSTWSPRSGEILEDFRRYHEEYASRGLRILAVNVDGENLSRDRREAVDSYTREKDLPFPVLLDGNLEAFAAYGVMAHPSTVVLGKDGRIAYMLGGYPLSLREELKEAFLKVLDLYVEPPPPETVSVGYIPRNGALPYHNLGNNLLAKDRQRQALAAFRTARERDPSFLDPAVMIARISLLEGDTAEGEELIRSVDPASANRSDLQFLRGSLMIASGEFGVARETFLELHERAPDRGWGLWGLGMTALADGNPQEALEKMNEAATFGPPPMETGIEVRKYLTKIWVAGDSSPLEEGFLALFPTLGDLRDRYRSLYKHLG